MKKIVIFMQNREFFGAQVVHIPLIKVLKARYPQHHITLFSKHQVSKVLSSFVDEIVIERSKWHGLREYFAIGADVTINLRKKSSFINFYIALLNRQTKIGFTTPLTKLCFTQNKAHNPTTYRASNYLNLMDETMKYESSSKVQRICIIAGAGEDFKIYPIRSYIELATKLKKRYPEYEIAFVLGQKESALQEYIKEPFKVYFDCEIEKLFEVISTSSLVVSNDCGPSHIAQISDVANIILYSDEKGNADKVVQEWFNPKDNAIYLSSEKNKKIATIEVQDIFREATKLLG